MKYDVIAIFESDATEDISKRLTEHLRGMGVYQEAKIQSDVKILTVTANKDLPPELVKTLTEAIRKEFIGKTFSGFNITGIMLKEV